VCVYINLGTSILVLLAFVVGFSFFSTSQSIGWVNVSNMTCFVSVGHKALTQSVGREICDAYEVFDAYPCWLSNYSTSARES